jgi:hypothetical protein
MGNIHYLKTLARGSFLNDRRAQNLVKNELLIVSEIFRNNAIEKLFPYTESISQPCE